MMKYLLLTKIDAILDFLQNHNFSTLSESMDTLEKEYERLVQLEINPVVKIGMAQMFKYITTIDISKIQSKEIWIKEVQQKCHYYKKRITKSSQKIIEKSKFIFNQRLNVVVICNSEHYLLKDINDSFGNFFTKLSLCTYNPDKLDFNKEVFSKIYTDPMSFRFNCHDYQAAIILPSALNQSSEAAIDLKEYIQILGENDISQIYMAESFRFDLLDSHPRMFRQTFFPHVPQSCQNFPALTDVNCDKKALIICEYDHFPAFASASIMAKIV